MHRLPRLWPSRAGSSFRFKILFRVGPALLVAAAEAENAAAGGEALPELKQAASALLKALDLRGQVIAREAEGDRPQG